MLILCWLESLEIHVNNHAFTCDLDYNGICECDVIWWQEDHTGVNLTFFFGAYTLYLYDHYIDKRVREFDQVKKENELDCQVSLLFTSCPWFINKAEVLVWKWLTLSSSNYTPGNKLWRIQYITANCFWPVYQSFSETLVGFLCVFFSKTTPHKPLNKFLETFVQCS